MATYRFLNFIKARIEKLGTALFYNYSMSVIKFPATVIRIFKVDQDANVWFKMRNPYNDISGFDKEFPAELHFYKKDCSYYITLRGEVTITTEQKELPFNQPGFFTPADEHELLLRFKISTAEYFPIKEKTRPYSLDIIRDFIKSLLIDEPNYHLAFN